MHRLFWIITSISFVACCIACGGGGGSGGGRGSARPDSNASESQEATATPAVAERTPYNQGDSFTVGYTSYAVWSSWWQGNLSSNEFLDRHPNAAFLFVKVTIRNNDRQARMVPPFKLVDENNCEYEADSGASILPGAVSILESLNPSVQKDGFIVFDVPTGHTYRLKVSGGYWSAEDAFVLLSPASSRDNVDKPKSPEEIKAQIKAAKKYEVEQRLAEEREETEAKWRDWTSKDGEFKIHACFRGIIEIKSYSKKKIKRRFA
jgi:hypothetical protein